MKIDCSKTENYLREKARMTKNCDDCLEKCPFSCANNGEEIGCEEFQYKFPKTAVEIVQKWSDEHQQKTYKEDFFEKFPNAPKYESGYPYPMVNPKYIYGDIFENTAGITDCWDKIMEE